MASTDENNYEHLQLQSQQGNTQMYECFNSQTPKQTLLFFSSLTFWRIVTICLIATNICSISLTVYAFHRYNKVQTDSYGATTKTTPKKEAKVDIDKTLMPTTTGTTRIVLQACASSPCYNNGNCTEVGEEGTNFTCVCPMKYKGELCEHHIDCPVDWCKNGGRCNNCNGVFCCTCKNGYSGETCEVETPCSTANCRDGTICIEMGQGYDCNNDHILDQLIKHDGSYCDPGWLQWSIYCYWISDYRANWTMAFDKCKEKSSSLLQVKTKYEIDWLRRIMDTDVWVNGRWQRSGIIWENPSMVLSNHSSLWERCEPNGSGHCIQIWYNDGRFLLDDTLCEDEQIFVCKYKPGSLN